MQVCRHAFAHALYAHTCLILHIIDISIHCVVFNCSGTWHCQYCGSLAPGHWWDSDPTKVAGTSSASGGEATSARGISLIAISRDISWYCYGLWHWVCNRSRRVKEIPEDFLGWRVSWWCGRVCHKFHAIWKLFSRMIMLWAFRWLQVCQNLGEADQQLLLDMSARGSKSLRSYW